MKLRNPYLSLMTLAVLACGDGAAAAQSAFNPQISVILDGGFYSDSVHGEAFEIIEEAAGFGGGHHHEDDHAHGGHGLERGFNIRELEIGIQATVDPYFDAFAMLTLDNDGGMELEEAYATTRALPAGLQLKFGKFLSDIGYINRQHPHQWHFTDRPLVNQQAAGA